MLEEVKATPQRIKERNVEWVLCLKHAIIGAYSAALKPPTNEEIKEWKELETRILNFGMFI